MAEEKTNSQLLSDLLTYNKESIDNMMANAPDIYTAFLSVVDTIKKEYNLEDVQPTTPAEPIGEGFWRVMTEQELIDKYGSVGNVPAFNSEGKMNWMFGKRVKDLIKDDLSEDEIGEKLNSGASIYTKDELDPDGRGEWALYNDFVVFDTSATQQQISEPQDYRVMTVQEISDRDFKGQLQGKIFGISASTWDKDFAGKKLSEIAKKDFDSTLKTVQKAFKEGRQDVEMVISDNAFSILIKYLEPITNATQTKYEFKVGDKVKLPLTKSYGDSYGNSNAISTAIDKGQKYLYVVNIYPGEDRIDLWYQPNPSGDYFLISQDNIELYEEPTTSTTTPTTQATPTKKEWKPEDLVGKTLLATNGTKWSVTKLLRNNPKNKRYELVDEKGETQIYNIGFNVVKKWLDGQTAAGWKIIDEPQKQLYTLNVETDPAQVEYNIGFKENKGDRNSPSQGAGDLKFVYGNMPDAYNTIFNTKFKGNDGEWYKIHVGKTGTWTWRKAK